MRDLNLKSTEYFEATARLGSLSRAAEELGVSPSAVSQQIAALESQLRVRLFRRENRRLVLTADGDRFYQTATMAFSAIRNARSAIAQEEHLRSLTIRVSPSFGVRWLGPRVGAFAAENPDWAIRIDATPDFTEFETENADLDLRYGLGTWSGVTVVPMLHDLLLPLCSPAYRDRLAEVSPDPRAQLAAARLIDSVKALCRWDLWLAYQQIDLPRFACPFRFDRSSMSIEMARQGGGVCLESAALCLGELERGELVPLSTAFDVIDFAAYWMVCPARHLNRRIVRRFSDWLAENTATHDAAARTLLTAAGCHFREARGTDLISTTTARHLP